MQGLVVVGRQKRSRWQRVGSLCRLHGKTSEVGSKVVDVVAVDGIVVCLRVICLGFSSIVVVFGF